MRSIKVIVIFQDTAPSAISVPGLGYTQNCLENTVATGLFANA